MEQLQDHQIDEAVLKAAQAETARSGAREKGDAGPGQEANPAVNAESPLSGESRVIESQAGQYKPLQAHQDVQSFLFGIHKSAEKEAQAEVDMLRQQEHSKMMNELFRR